MQRAVTLIGFVAISACGSAAGPSYEPPYVTLRGTVTSSSVPTARTVHVALVWNVDPKSSGSSSFRATQELDVRAEFPAAFRMDVRTLPPAEAMMPIDVAKAPPGSATAFAYGTLVVYEDTNENGTLDLIPFGGAAPIDRILGAPDRLEIVYLEGGGLPKDPTALPTDEGFLDHTAGFNLILEPARAPLEPGCAVCATAVGPWTRLPLDADLTVALTSDPRLSRAICEQADVEGGTATSGCMPCVAAECAKCPLPADAALICNADKTAFVAHACASRSVCAELTCETVSGRREPDSAVPLGWPCP